MRALLSVYDKTGHRRVRPRRCTSSAWSSCRGAAPRGRSPEAGRPGRRRRRGHRVARDARPPGRHAAPEDPRRDPRRPRQGVAPGRHGDARHRRRSTSSVRTSTRSPSDPTSRLIDIGGPAMVARRGEEPRVGRRSSRAPTSTTTVLDELREQRRARPTTTRRALALEAFARTAAYDAAIVEWLQDGEHAAAAPRAPARAHRRDAALRREPAPARRRATGCAARRAGGTASRSTAGSRSATSTSTTPTPRGSSCTTSATARPCAIIKHANPCGVAVADDLATAYQRALECDERSAFGGIVALNRPIDDATVERDGRGPAGRRRDRARATRRARSTR